MSERIGFISTRFAGIDGVSLESAKWAEVLWDLGHVSSWYAGRLDRAANISLCIPEAHFDHPVNQWIDERIWGKSVRSPEVTDRIVELASYLKGTIAEFARRFELTFLIVENALSIPMHVPLGLALTEFIAETHFPVIAHHHDFYWERQRFLVNAASDYLDTCFPPRGDLVQHVAINQPAQEELAWRRGLSSTLIPNVLNFEQQPSIEDGYAADARAALGLDPGDIMILQPTRVVPRKGIEHAIALVEMLKDPRCKLVVSHDAGDEGFEYQANLAARALRAGVDLRFVATRVGERRRLDTEGRKVYSLADLYPLAGLVTYPSLYEGFGNAFLEAIYYRVPVLINRYGIFASDIEPKGFKVPIMEGFVTDQIVEQVKRLLVDRDHRAEVVEHNYRTAAKFYSYAVLRRHLRVLISNVAGFSR